MKREPSPPLGSLGNKTLAAVLAIRVVGSKVTVICCPNSVVEGWRLCTFPPGSACPISYRLKDSKLGEPMSPRLSRAWIATWKVVWLGKPVSVYFLLVLLTRNVTTSVTPAET